MSLRRVGPALSHLFHGIGQADSVTCDAHKWLPVPMGAGMFLSRHHDALMDLFSVDVGHAACAENGEGEEHRESRDGRVR